ncbi:helix-turn-helix domain-containing protein [Rhizobium leguminosarum]
MDEGDDTRLLTIKEVAMRLAISAKTLIRHANRGRIGCFNVGTEERRHLRFELSQVNDFLSGSRIREVPRCPSIKVRPARSTSMTSKSTGIAFTELPKPGTGGTPRP